MKQSCSEMLNLSPKECGSLHFRNQWGTQDPKWCLESPNQTLCCFIYSTQYCVLTSQDDSCFRSIRAATVHAASFLLGLFSLLLSQGFFVAEPLSNPNRSTAQSPKFVSPNISNPKRKQLWLCLVCVWAAEKQSRAQRIIHCTLRYMSEMDSVNWSLAACLFLVIVKQAETNSLGKMLTSGCLILG